MSQLWRRALRELYRIRYRLLLVNALVVAVPIVGIGFARFYEREMLGALENDMIHQAQLLRQVLLADPAGLRLGERGPLLARAARDTRTRIRMLADSGQLVADSHASGPPEGEELAERSYFSSEVSERDSGARARVVTMPDISQRREVKQALAGDYGAATRLWRGAGRVYLFAALPIVRDAAGSRVEGVVYVTRSTAPVKLAMFRLRRSLVSVLAIALAFTTVLSLFLAGTISRPLTRLTRTAQRIAGGDRTASLALHRSDEIGDLARAFDEMAQELDRRARYVAELAANVSHEFKSPLTSLRGGAELLLEGAAEDPAARARFLRNMLEDCHRLDRLVTRLLELSRVDADVGPLELVDYEALVRETVRADAGVTLAYDARTLQVRGRRAHLGAALANLLDNARQHARADTPVRVRVWDLPGGGVRTSVHNQGAPISTANLPRLWDRFFTTRADRGGTGLGLAIVASVAKGHGGAVGVDSSAEAGTTFWLDLPRA